MTVNAYFLIILAILELCYPRLTQGASTSGVLKCQRINDWQPNLKLPSSVGAVLPKWQPLEAPQDKGTEWASSSLHRLVCWCRFENPPPALKEFTAGGDNTYHQVAPHCILQVQGLGTCWCPECLMVLFQHWAWLYKHTAGIGLISIRPRVFNPIPHLQC